MLLREAIEQRKNLPLALTRLDRPRPILDLCGLPRPEQRKPLLANFIEKVAHACRLHVHLEELFFEVLKGGCEGFEQHAASPTDQRMPTNQLSRMGGIEMQKARRERAHPKRSAHHVKSLHGRPRIRVQLSQSHVKCLKDTGHERIKGKGHMEVRKKAAVHEKEGGFGR